MALTAKKVTEDNHLPGTGDGRFVVYSKQFNKLVDAVNELEPADGTLSADTISEATSGSGVTVDSVLLKDGEVTTDTINESTAANGVEVDGLKIKDGGLLNVRVPIVSGDSIDTAGAVTLTTAQSGTTFLVDKADGLAFTTPDSGAGDIIGCTYKFIVTTSITSGAFSISGATADNLMQGGVMALDFDTADVVDFFTPDADTDVFSANGGTTGGKEGTVITITNIAADSWFIEGVNVGDGVIVTPFD